MKVFLFNLCFTELNCFCEAAVGWNNDGIMEIDFNCPTKNHYEP